MSHSYDFAMIGGDMRQVYLAKELADCGFHVCSYALCKEAVSHISPEETPVVSASSLMEACDAACIVCPIPLCKTGMLLNQTANNRNLRADAIFSYLQKGQFLFAGCIPDDMKTEASKKGILFYDLMDDLRLSHFNSMATAEGAICEAIAHSPVNLRKSNCAVLGYGTCGKTICQYLVGMLCHVCVIAEPEKELAEALSIAEKTVTLTDFQRIAGRFDFIFNTIPKTVVDAAILKNLKPNALIIDIASAPGGVDYEAAKESEVPAILCPGLPGIYAPSSSAKAILETIKSILKE